MVGRIAPLLIAAAAFFGAAATAAAQSSPPLNALHFSANSPYNRVEGHDFPHDMPAVRFPTIKHCGGNLSDVRDAWAFAHYNTWRTREVFDYLRHSGERVVVQGVSMPDRRFLLSDLAADGETADR